MAFDKKGSPEQSKILTWNEEGAKSIECGCGKTLGSKNKGITKCAEGTFIVKGSLKCPKCGKSIKN